jgi:hypothetical protein
MLLNTNVIQMRLPRLAPNLTLSAFESFRGRSSVEPWKIQYC